VRRNWWRDERSNMAWKCFEQMQFISYYAIISVVYPTRLISFTRVFDWTNFAIPIPHYTNRDVHPERTLQNLEQYGNSFDAGTEQVFYATILWFAIFLGGCCIATALSALVLSFIKGANSREIFFGRVIHVALRLVNASYIPVCIVAAAHTKSGFGATVAASIIVLLLWGLGFPALAFFLIYNKKKQFFMYGYRLRFGSLFGTFHFNHAPFVFVVFAKKLAIALLIGFMAFGQGDQRFAIGQVIGSIGVLIIYVAAIVVRRPFLDRTHMLLEIALSMINIITLGIALTHYNKPSNAGEIIFPLLQVVGLFLCIGAFINNWVIMEHIHSFAQLCGKKTVQPDSKRGGRPSSPTSVKPSAQSTAAPAAWSTPGSVK